MPTWNASQYLKFAGERTQPAIDLAQRINLNKPQQIIDLGCGPGNSTEVLRQHWPNAAILGLDSSVEMIEAARKKYPNALWQVGNALSWKSDEPLDLVFSNAMLQWLPDHAKFCQHWLSQVKVGGALAVQIPAHYNSPVHKEIIEVSNDPAWSDRLQAARTALEPHSPFFYYDVLHPLATRVDLWETIYYHILEGPEEILEWFKGTGLRPFLEALASDHDRSRFEHMLLERYQIAYPRQANGKVLFPFRRLFFVAYC